MGLSNQIFVFGDRLSADNGPCRETFEEVEHFYPVNFAEGDVLYGVTSVEACKSQCRGQSNCQRFVFVRDPAKVDGARDGSGILTLGRGSGDQESQKGGGAVSVKNLVGHVFKCAVFDMKPTYNH